MTDGEETARKELRALVFVGFSILVLLWAGFVWINYYVVTHGGIDVLIAVTPFCMLPYSIVMGIYVGLFMARFARGRWRHPWLWGITGFALTALFSVSILALLSPIFPSLSPVLFAFVVPVLSIAVILRLISIRKKVSL